MPAFLEARGICKSFPGVQALAGVELTVRAGEILAVVGENGAGKSTLMKILGGVHAPEAGSILIEGTPTFFRSVQDAERHGIVLIHQELNLVPDLDIAGNVFLGREPTRFWPLRLLDPVIYENTRRITEPLGQVCSPRTRVADLALGQQQLVEIARALSLKSRLLILDEPTSSLTDRETERLFSVLRGLRADGLAVVFISHRLKEIEEIADRVVVFRDGAKAGELSREEIAHEPSVRLMVGRELKQYFHRSERPRRDKDAQALSVRGLRWSPRQQPIDFHLDAGEIVGMAGLMGSGRTELAETIFGVRRRLSGEVQVEDEPVSARGPAHAIAAGIFLVPEDRRREGLVLAFPVKKNVSLASMDLVTRLGLVASSREAALATRMSGRLHVRSAGIDQFAFELSGGNQQKVVLAKWLCRTPRVLILDEPTRGIDVGAKSEIYALMDELAGQGLSILMISSDLEEILGMSDRVLVMHQETLAGQLTREELSEQAIMRLATGGSRPS